MDDAGDNNVEKVMEKLRREMLEMTAHMSEAKERSGRKSVTTKEHEVGNSNTNTELETIIPHSSTDVAIAEKVAELENKDKLIKLLEANVNTLKETCSVLDQQLEEFMDKFNDQLEALSAANQANEFLESDNKQIREQLVAARVELNEAKSLKAFTENRLQKTENALKSQSETTETEVQTLREQLSLARMRNEELSEEVSLQKIQIGDFEQEKIDFQKQVEHSKTEKERLVKELHSLLKAVVDCKGESSNLKAILSEAVSETEVYKGKLQASEENCEMLEQNNATTELAFTTRIKQQDKLIDHLRDQLAGYQDKKKKSIFTPKRSVGKDKDTASTPTKVSKVLSFSLLSKQ